jgi:CheY-like chemotaxis protein/HPt (histidine-containing phosphotransfer) domain-containing protein
MLLNDLLDLSKIEAGRIDIETQVCNLQEILDSVSSVMYPQALTKHLRFAVIADPALPRHLRTDPTRLRQILYNLSSNAVKFTDSGSVTVWVDRLTPTGQDGVSTLSIAVQDTGIGIAADRQEAIFEAFTQASDPQDPRGGSGLGLAVSRRLATLMGGQIHVESTPGRGSTFTLELPLLSADAASASEAEPLPAEPPEPRPLAGYRILLVDDNPDNRQIVRFMLEPTGAELEMRQNGRTGYEAGLEAAHQGAPYDVVLMDIRMPEMDGYEATLRLREAGVETRIVALTAHATAENESRCRDAGCDAVVTKPIQPADLLEAITSKATMRHGTAHRAGAPAAVSNPRRESPPEPLFSRFHHNPRFAPLLTDYRRSLQQRVEALEHHRAQREAKDLRTLCHDLKGSGGMYGYPTLSEVADRCQDLLDADQPWSALDPALDDLRRVIQAILAAPD